MFLWRKDKALEYFNISDLDDIYNAVENQSGLLCTKIQQFIK